MILEKMINSDLHSYLQPMHSQKCMHHCMMHMQTMHNFTRTNWSYIGLTTVLSDYWLLSQALTLITRYTSALNARRRQWCMQR